LAVKDGTDNINIRMPFGLREGLRALSKANNRSMNGQVVDLIQSAVASSPKPIPQNTIEKEEK
jgi:hypothetical protein